MADSDYKRYVLFATLALTFCRTAPAQQSLGTPQGESGTGAVAQIEDRSPDKDLRAGREPWQMDFEPDLTPSLRAHPADIEGSWKAPATEAPSASLRRLKDGLYLLTFKTGGCLGDWELQRQARYENGVLSLDFPAMEYPAKRFQRLFVIEIAGEQYLLPAPDVDRYIKLLAGKDIDDLHTLTWHASWWMKRQTGTASPRTGTASFWPTVLANSYGDPSRQETLADIPEKLAAAKSTSEMDRVSDAADCRLSIAQPQACAQSSLFLTLRCRSESQKPLEWLEPNDSRAEWELKRPDGQVERRNVSRYSTSAELVRVALGNDLNLTLPVTRWFPIKIPGVYSLRFQLKDRANSVQIETNAAEFNVAPCSDDTLIKACCGVLQGTNKNRLEAIAGFDSPAAVPCMEEALQEQSEFSVSIIDGLARMQTASAIEALLRRFKTGNAFERLRVWQALHRIDRSKLGADLPRRIDAVLKETPITMKD